MAKSAYDVIECEAGREQLQSALNAVPEEAEVISVLPNHHAAWYADSSKTTGYLIVVRRSA